MELRPSISLAAFLLVVCGTNASRLKISPSDRCYRWPFDPDAPPYKLRESIRQSGYASSVAPPPTSADGEYVDVDVNLTIEELLALNDVAKEVSITATLDVGWTDPRLAMDDLCRAEANITSCDDIYVQMIKTEDLDTVVYKPGLKVINLKEVFERDFMYEVDGYALVNGCSGRITTHASVRFLLSCDFDFRDYPFDQQRCELTFYAPTYDDLSRTGQLPSWAQSSGKLRLRWASDPTILQFKYGNRITSAGNFDQFILVQRRTEKCDSTCDNHLKIVLVYDRVQVGYWVQTLIPSFLLVIASYGSLWVPSDQIPGRMSLAVTTTLTLMGMVNSVFQTSPDTAYLKAMDLWLITCFIFTFLVLTEFCLVIALSRPNPLPNTMPNHAKALARLTRKKKDEAELRRRRGGDKREEMDEDDADEVDEKFEKRKKKQKHQAAIIETGFKFILPLVYVIFVTVFFACYAGTPSLKEDEGYVYQPIEVLDVQV